jgi:hypothetical protein
MQQFRVNVFKARGAGGAHAKVPVQVVVVEATDPMDAARRVYESMKALCPKQRWAAETVPAGVL